MPSYYILDLGLQSLEHSPQSDKVTLPDNGDTSRPVSVEVGSTPGMTSTTHSEEWTNLSTCYTTDRHCGLPPRGETSPQEPLKLGATLPLSTEAESGDGCRMHRRTSWDEVQLGASSTRSAEERLEACALNSSSSFTTVCPAVMGSTRCQSTSCTASPLSVRTPLDSASKGFNRLGVQGNDLWIDEELVGKDDLQQWPLESLYFASDPCDEVNTRKTSESAWHAEVAAFYPDTPASYQPQNCVGAKVRDSASDASNLIDRGHPWNAPISASASPAGSPDPPPTIPNTTSGSPQLSALEKLVARLPLAPDELEEMERRERVSWTSVLSRNNLRAHQQQLRQCGPSHYFQNRKGITEQEKRAPREHLRNRRCTDGGLNDVLHECRFLGMDDVLASVTNLSPYELQGTQRAFDGHEVSVDTTASSAAGVETSPTTSAAASPESSCRFPANLPASHAPSHITPGQALFLAAAMTEKSLFESECATTARSPELFTAWHENTVLCRADSSLNNNSILMSPLSTEGGSPFRQRTRCIPQISAAHVVPFDPLEHKVCNSESNRGISVPATVMSQGFGSVRMTPPSVISCSVDSSARHPSYGKGESSVSTQMLDTNCITDIVFTLTRKEGHFASIVCRSFSNEVNSVKDLIRWAAKAADVEPVLSTDTELAT